jgi:hypothetical protein
MNTPEIEIFKDSDRELAQKVLSNLLTHRDFLCHQLEYARGMISDGEMMEIRNKYFEGRVKYDPDDLARHAMSLVELIPNLDADSLSTVMYCDLNDAIKAIKTAGIILQGT